MTTPVASAAGPRAIEVLAAPGLVTIQDGGRPGHAHLGVPPSGAVDLPSLALANALVGNPPNSAALETTLAGVRLRALAACVIAVTGAEADIELDGAPARPGQALALAAGVQLRVGPARAGARSYVAIDGAIAAVRVLGSSATDLLTGLGPPPVRSGDALGLGPTPEPAVAPPASHAAVPTPPPTQLGDARLAVALGPRADRFSQQALATLASEPFTVSPASNRIGIRLSGPLLDRHDDELASEGVVAGAIQVPPSGEPILLLSDHPTTGGYPVIGVVLRRSLARAGQLRPGEQLHFAVVTA